MSANLGTILVGLGYDLSALEKGAPEAFRLVNSQTLGMSAEMKRASREGAESLRLIDEALGIHLSRPLTRLLTQEFPALATGLQSILGVGAFGAIGVAGIEFFDKISKGIEHAEKAQEEYANAVQHTENVTAELGASHARAMKEISLELAEKQGQPGAKLKAIDFKIDTSALEQAHKDLGEVNEATEKLSKAAADASKWYTELAVAAGYVARNFFGSSDKQQEEAQEKFKTFAQELDKIRQAAAADPLAGLRLSLQRVNAELNTTGAEIAQKMAALQTAEAAANHPGARSGAFQQTKEGQAGAGISPAALATEQQYFAMLKNEESVLRDILQEVEARQTLAAAPDAAEQLRKQVEAQRELSELYKTMGAGIAKLQPETDPIKKLSNEIYEMEDKAVDAFNKLRESAASNLSLQAAFAAVDRYEERLDAIFAKAKREADVDKATANLPSNTGLYRPTGLYQILNTTAPGMTPAPPPVMPQLGSGGTAGAQVSAFQADENAQLKMAAQAYQDAMTPLDKYNVALAELKILLNDGKISQAAFAAAAQHAGDQLERADKKLIHARDGLKSFFAEMQQDSNVGRFTFDILNQGLKGFEDQVVKIVTTGKANWREYFLSLEQAALKFFLNKEIMAGLKDLSGTSMGQSLGLGKLMGGGGAQAAASTQMSAGTLMQTAATQQMAAAQLMASSSSGAGGGSAGGFAGDLSDSGDYSEYASGTDYTPGGMALVGEEGPEMVNLPTGSSVTPNSQLRSSSPSIHLHIDAKGAEIGVEEKIARAISASAPQMIMRAVTASSEVQKRSLQRG